MVLNLSVPARYSEKFTSLPSPETSEKPASMGLPPATSPNSTLKLNAPYGLSRLVATESSFVSAASVRGPLADPEDDELGRLHGRHPDEADEPAVVEIVLGHGRAVAVHEVRLVRGGSEQGAV